MPAKESAILVSNDHKLEDSKLYWKKKDLLTLQELSDKEIQTILQTSKAFKEILMRPIKKVPALRGKTVVTLFFEPSTRTHMSFELAAKRLSADTMSVTIQTSSVKKGESLEDTVKNIQAMKVHAIVVRHSSSGVAQFLANILETSVINAGDGSHEHPTQGLLDIFTMQEKKGQIKDLKVAIVGDISHSRVARSNIWGLIKLGAQVKLVGPKTLVPKVFEKLGLEVHYDLKTAIQDVDVINILRIQNERIESQLFPSIREYSRLFGVTNETLKYAKKDVLIMHPGPINRGVEISSDIADGPHSVILDQVTNGLAVRMAVLYLLLGGRGATSE